MPWVHPLSLSLFLTLSRVGSEFKKTDMERIFHFLIVKNILKEIYKNNAGGFNTGYIKVGGGETL